MVGRLDSDCKALLSRDEFESLGEIQYTEFLAAALKTRDLTEDAIRLTFNAIDQDGDGKISRSDLAQVVGDDDSDSLAAGCAAACVDDCIQEAGACGKGW